MPAITLRIRGPNGMATIRDLTADVTLEEFQQKVFTACGVGPAQQQFKAGFPPRKLELQGLTIADLKLNSGETLILERCSMERQVQIDSACINNSRGPGTSVAGMLPDGRAVVSRIIASDNSCLFNAVAYNLERTRSAARQLRQVVRDTVEADPFTFNDGMLGKDNRMYQDWIMNMDHWGGPIELVILARHFRCEIAAFDIRTKRCDIYGQEEQYGSRCMLMYDGLHYDALVVAAVPDAPEEVDCTVFDPAAPDADQIMRAAEDLICSLHAQRKFTDTANFTLRCGTCLIGLKGETEAVEHAKSTGHTNFQEYQ
eukprot:jgi/Ulvmu1/12878/UM098_0066.1